MLDYIHITAMETTTLRRTLTITATVFLSIAVSIFFIRRKQRKHTTKQCYLNTEPKPQSTFKRVLADNSYSQFKHLKLHKTDDSPDEYSNLHPYKAEIAKLLKNPKIEFLEDLDQYFSENGCSKIDDSYVWVETEDKLKDLEEVLSKERVFAVDTEQHSLRSFLGFTALIQISTKREDYLVDTITLHDKMGILRGVFADPEICKVFHGADNDVLWLQRDFHIYVVNLFDTAKACDVLMKPQRSLAYLLETYCGVATNKLFQREDWRQRPLPDEMVQYAQTDAHYLLYIASCLSTELKQQKTENSSPGDKFHFLLEASQRSNSTCLQLFTKDMDPYPGESAASSIISRCLNDQGNVSSNACDSKFQELVRQLCAWRDVMARIHDESLRFVLSDSAIAALAANPESDISTTIYNADLDAISMNLTSLPSPSPIVLSHIKDLQYLLRDKIDELNHVLQLLVQQNLGPDGTCPLSGYNYALLSQITLRKTNASTSYQNGFRAARQVAKKASRELFVQKFSCKSPVYHNCKIYANDGRLLCYCDRKKLEWYLNRNLAKLVEDSPPAVMLLFEPKGRPEDEGNDFYIQSKKNICVGCGEGNHYLRYRIIPSCYRMHFPEHLKSHRSHDIVLLCVDCHEKAHAAAEKYKRKVAAEFGIPLFVRKVVNGGERENGCTDLRDEEDGVSPLQLRTAAMALMRHGPRMPAQRREELLQTVKKYYGGREISDMDLERALLVGMSPHERRKFEKKRRLVSKNSNRSGDLAENTIHTKESASVRDTSDGEIVDSLYNNSAEVNEKEGYINITKGEDGNIETEPLFSSAIVNGDSNVIECDSVQISNSEDISGNQKYATNGDVPTNHESKLSLLGHGPHGKQVVEHLLKEYGDDGISHFCQRWRQAFVEAINPRFLPAGWDVMHSGRREFGDFSVYRPAKGVSTEAV